MSSETVLATNENKIRCLGGGERQPDYTLDAHLDPVELFAGLTPSEDAVVARTNNVGFVTKSTKDLGPH